MTKKTEPNGGVNIGDSNVTGSNVAGGDQQNIGGDLVSGNKIIGLSERFVLRLIVAVGVLVFFTAACFFSGGVVVSFAAINALNKPVGSSEPEARAMQQKLDTINRLPSGRAFNVSFTEDEISSYVKFIAGPQFGLNDGKVRLLDENKLVVAGHLDALGGAQVAATFRLTNGEPTLQLESAAVQVLPLGNSSFGWVAIPSSTVQAVATQVNARMFGNVRVTNMRPQLQGNQITWMVSGVKR
jgi:hypothetical protein